MRVKLGLGEFTLPDFMIVGAGKSGTTSLHHYLSEHPDVYMPWHKETWFFHLVDNPNKAILKKFPYLPTNFISYLGLYADAKLNQICGEATPSYLYFHDLAIPNIKRYHPQWQKLKIIIILREPIDKVISHYKFVHTQKLDPDNLSLKEALLAEPARKRENKILQDVFYVDNTLYAEQVKAYIDNFPNVKVFLYDELVNDREKVIKDLFDFVGVDINFKSSSFVEVHNKSRQRLIPRNDLAAKFINSKKLKSLTPPFLKRRLDQALSKEEVIDDETINLLKRSFKEDVQRLEGIINKDLSHWLVRYNG